MTISILADLPPIRDTDGVFRIGQTGVTLETVLWAFQHGSTPEDIVEQFPTLTLAEVYSVIAYYLRHRDEMERYLEARERHYQDLTTDLLRSSPETRLRALLRTRRLGRLDPET